MDLSQPNNLYSSTYNLYISTSLINSYLQCIYFRKFSDLYYLKSDSSAFDVIVQFLSNLLTC